MCKLKNWTKPERVLLDTLRDLETFDQSHFWPEGGDAANEAWSELREKARERAKTAFAAVLAERGRRLVRERKS